MAQAGHASPDGGPTLADGAVVRAHVVARLLGVRLLRLDATVVVTPPSAPETSDLGGPVVLGATVSPRTEIAPLTSIAPSTAVDGGLPEAERLLRLARSERSGRRHR
ncbi:hypothetical protein [Mumia sp.]|nr:hypothetical protein [Mumia sp.]MDD9347600.1 hypothetical protein [Mumia sp.]